MTMAHPAAGAGRLASYMVPADPRPCMRFQTDVQQHPGQPCVTATLLDMLPPPQSTARRRWRRGGGRTAEDFGSRLLWVLTVLTALGLGYVWLSPPVQVANNCPQVRIVPEPRCGIIC